MDSILKIILFPFSVIYGLVISFRNFLYDVGIFSSQNYNFPLISIGNLSVGGTGKTPHTEFIINYFKYNFKVASLSRGYGRKTKGYRLANENDNAKTIGDEPYQIFKKFKNVIVAVAEKRRKGIEELRKLDSPPNLIVLDDAFQHRSVKPGLNILLTDYSHLYKSDIILPSGRLREARSGARRADFIIVTKSPSVLSPLEIRRIAGSLKPTEYQKVFFSYISYKEPFPLNQAAINLINEKEKLASNGVLLVSAIANPESLKLHLKRFSKEVITMPFKDHHHFEQKDYQKITKKLDDILSSKKAIVITEKDAVKFDATQFENTPVFSIPITIKFHEQLNQSFTEELDNYVRSYRKSS